LFEPVDLLLDALDPLFEPVDLLVDLVELLFDLDESLFRHPALLAEDDDDSIVGQRRP
jgi:hypothetical protein